MPASHPPSHGSPEPLDEPTPGGPADRSARRPSRLAIKALGLLIAVAALAVCVYQLVDQWGRIHDSITHSRPLWIVVGLVAAGASMTGLGVLWWRCLRTFDSPVTVGQAVSWYFGGELGKYLPGGVWSVLGRGELARRAGVPRATGYVTTLVSYLAMCVAAAVVCGVLAPVIAAQNAALSWGWLMLALIPVGIAAVHPAVLGRLLALGNRVTHGRVPLSAPPWRTMLVLIGWSLPTWVLAGGAYVAVTAALRYDQHPAQVAFAAVAAWILGFLAVPVPAGVGVREIVFVACSGLAGGPAVAVAAIVRLLFILVDAGGGLAGLAAARRAGVTGTPSAGAPTTTARSL